MTEMQTDNKTFKISELPAIQNIDDDDLLIVSDKEQGKFYTKQMTMRQLFDAALDAVDVSKLNSLSSYTQTKAQLSSDGYALKADVSSAADISVELSLSDYIKEIPAAYKTYDNTKTALSADGYALASDIPTYADISGGISLSDYTQLTTTTELRQNCEKTEKVVNDQVLRYKTWDIQYTPSSGEKTGGNDQMTNIPDYYTIFFTPSVYRDSVNAIKKFTLMITSTANQVPANDVYIKLVDPATHKVLAVTDAVRCSQNATVEFTFNKLAYLDPHKEYWLKICATSSEDTYEDRISAFGLFVQTKANNPVWTPDLHYMNTNSYYLSAYRPVMTVTWTDNKVNDYVLTDSLYNEYSLSAVEGVDTVQTDKGIVSMVSVCLSAFDNDYESITQFGFQRRDTQHNSDAYLSNQTLYAFGSTAAALTNLNESNIYLSSLNSFKYPGYSGIVTNDLTSTGKILPDNTDYLYFYFLSTDVITSESLANYSKYSIGIRQYRFNEGKAPNYVLPTLIYQGNIWYPAISIKYKKSKLAEKQWVEDKLGDVEDKLGDIESALDIINNGDA